WVHFIGPLGAVWEHDVGGEHLAPRAGVKGGVLHEPRSGPGAVSAFNPCPVIGGTECSQISQRPHRQGDERLWLGDALDEHLAEVVLAGPLHQGVRLVGDLCGWGLVHVGHRAVRCRSVFTSAASIAATAAMAITMRGMSSPEVLPGNCQATLVVTRMLWPTSQSSTGPIRAGRAPRTRGTATSAATKRTICSSSRSDCWSCITDLL